MNLLEFIIAISIIALLFTFSPRASNHSLESAQTNLLSHIKALQIVALSDDSAFVQGADANDMLKIYPSLNASALLGHHHNSMWQIQFHLGRVYATHSYSIYIDTPRHTVSTHFDSRPMAGDIILKNMDRKCLSGYNNTNTSQECKNNALPSVRLGEYFGIEYMLIESDSFCKERDSARIYFDRLGVPYCGKIPRALNSPFKITLIKGNKSKNVCVLPKSGLVLTQC